MTSDRRPIIHVGLVKTGSTWLQRHGFATIDGLDVLTLKTARHLVEQVLQHLKEPSPRPAVDDLRQPIDTCSGIPVISSENFASPWGWTPEKGLGWAPTLKRLFPDAKILMVVREQASMVSSFYAQYVKQGGYVSFRRFIAGDIPHSRFDATWLEYHRHVEAFHAHFDASDVLVLPYEQLRADPHSFLAATARFAGLTYDGDPDGGRRMNPTPSNIALAGLRVVNRLVRRSELNPSPILFPLPGASRARGIAQRYPATSAARVLGRGDAQRALALARQCAGSNRRLAELGGVDLRRWGYRVGDAVRATP